MSDTHNSGDSTASQSPLTQEDIASKVAKISPGLAGLLNDAVLSALAEPEFRVLSIKGERKGIRLEAVFWHALQQTASELKVPRNTLVLWIMAAAGEDRHNATSVLRSAILGYLLDEIKRLKALPEKG